MWEGEKNLWYFFPVPFFTWKSNNSSSGLWWINPQWIVFSFFQAQSLWCGKRCILQFQRHDRNKRWLYLQGVCLKDSRGWNSNSKSHSLPEPSTLSVGSQLLTNPLPLLGGCLIPKPMVRILSTDEETELRSKKVVTCANSQASSGRWAWGLISPVAQDKCSTPDNRFFSKAVLVTYALYTRSLEEWYLGPIPDMDE